MSLEEIHKRRTFAIISHPDAGKTTITEKLLLLGQLIQTAGTVKGPNRQSMGDVCYSFVVKYHKK